MRIRSEPVRGQQRTERTSLASAPHRVFCRMPFRQKLGVWQISDAEPANARRLADEALDFLHNSIGIQSEFCMEQVGRAVRNDSIRNSDPNKAGGHSAVLQKRGDGCSESAALCAFFEC